METRKIQQVSKGTFTVSLPREWARENGLSAGDVVHVHASLDGTLVVQPADDETANIDLAVCDESPEQLARLLRTAYVLGALRIRVSAEDGFTERQRTSLRATVRTLSGMAIDEESETGLTTKNVIDSEQVSIRQSVRHLQFVALSRHREATEALLGTDSARTTQSDDARGDRLAMLVERYFVRSLSRLDAIDKLGEDRADLFSFFRVADELAQIASCGDRIAAVALALEEPLCDRRDDAVAAEIEAAAIDAREAAETAAESVFDQNPDDIWSVLQTCDAVRETLDELERRLFESSEGNYEPVRALSAVRRTADCAASIASIGLRRGIQRDRFEASRVAEARTEDGSAVPSNADN
ncbi:AbrB/MazE/SpoVT family DNA-binding domain-containing protein [Halobellus litoreus]|uniref:AbrB/MazE/SpoVT family DNA-binding domain-containing protein n=1 Tax=Halobellus litoreus TaxID=755310 RepID=A0ABD6DWL6_9EURY|nr:phosphate uptake regulator PhoU [Halobellus litoreus]